MTRDHDAEPDRPESWGKAIAAGIGLILFLCCAYVALGAFEQRCVPSETRTCGYEQSQ